MKGKRGSGLRSWGCRKMGRCKDCEHWVAEKEDGHAYGECHHEDNTWHCPVLDDGWRSNSACIERYTGPDFGCVNFKRRRSV